MLLSIDRVLQLLAEGKSLEKISELAQCESTDVIEIIEDARQILKKYEKAYSKKKIIIKKRDNSELNNVTRNQDDNPLSADFLNGAELSAVPLGSILTMYTDGASQGNPGPAGIGIVIYDKEDRQVGKLSAYIGRGTNNFAEYTAIIRALKIAQYFKVREVKIRTDSELVVRQINGEYQVRNENIKLLYNQVMEILNKLPKVKIEHVTRNLNDKADYLAKKGATSIKRTK